MLAHSPPLPLIIDHNDNYHDLTSSDEVEGILLALQHRDRVRRIYLRKPHMYLQMLIPAMNGQFPVLEYFYIAPLYKYYPRLALPSTFEAPQLRMLALDHFIAPIGSPILTSAVGLVELSLRWIHPLTNILPNHLFQALSCLPQLQHLVISFLSSQVDHEIQQQLLDMSTITHTTLPNLRSFHFGGVSAYLEALLPHLNAPLLNVFDIIFFHPFNFSVPHLREFVTTTLSLGCSRVKFLFYPDAVAVFMIPSQAASASLLTFGIRIADWRLHWQVSSMAQMSNELGPLLSTAVELTLASRWYVWSAAWRNEVDPVQWRSLLEPFRNVETLRVYDGLVGDLSRCLALDGDSPPEIRILPKLKSLVCSTRSRDAEAFARFVDDRKVAGLPINVVEGIHPARIVDYKFRTAAGTEHVSHNSVRLRLA
jgi:hypothetical protein